MASKKKQEEIAKQIDIKKEFADKVYKKMRADRYGLTFCCPNDLQDINVKNYMCNWQDIGYETMPEEYTKNYTTNPIANYCAPPGIYNPVTGLCDAEAEQTLVGTTSYSFADSIPNGTSYSIVPANSPRYGRDCPIIFDSINSDGTGNNPYMIQTDDDNDPDNSWWKYYDATDPSGEFFNPLNPNVQNVNFCNALGKRPSGGWPASQAYEWAINVTPTATTTYHVAICADHKFALSTTTGGVTTDHITFTAFSVTNLVQMVGQADSNWDPDGLGEYSWADLIAQQGHAANDCHSASLYFYNQSIDPFTDIGDNNRTPAARWWIYPLELPAGCHRINIKGFNKDFEGMLAAAVWQNSKAEILAAESRSELTEIFASDLQTALYQNIDDSNPWTCEGPGLLFTSSPYNEDCPGCRIQSSTMVLQCPDGYVYNENTEICEGIFNTCDTETIMFEVVNQNGEVMPNYEITFDGGSYTTNSEGKLSIVIEAASVNTDHMLNLCHCITTGGGCAVQNIKITVTDPNIETCTPVDEICPCKSPALINTETNVLSDPTTATLTFQDLNLSNSSNTIESYIFEWRVYTEAGDGDWTIVEIVKPSSGTTFNVILELSGGIYEYRIKTKCTETESGYAGIYSIDIPTTFGEDLIGWWDFTDTTTLFTDIAGTTSVANDGDYIRRVNNKSTSTNKLGLFLRSIETTGWTCVQNQAPDFRIGGAGGHTYADMASQMGGCNGQPLTGSWMAGYGGVVDGVKFSELTNLNTQNFTVINVIDNTNGTLANSLNWQYMFTMMARNTSDGVITGTWLNINGSGLPSGDKKQQIIINGNSTNTNDNIDAPLVLEGPTISILRSTDDSNSNVHGRNEWDVNNTDPGVSYNQVNNFPLAPPDTYDFSGQAVGNFSPNVGLGAYIVPQGTSITFPWRGYIYESMVFNKKLTDVELESLVSFLKTKYGIL